MKEFTKDSLIRALVDIRTQGWIPTGRKNNDGGVGNTLEDLLGIEENNLPIPNAAEWELKAQKKGTASLVTLFHMEPSPRAFKFVPKILLPQFGWPHKKAGIKYPSSEKSFRLTINTVRYSNRGFSVGVDRVNRKVYIDFDADKIDRQLHSAWAQAVDLETKGKGLEVRPYWGFDDLFHKAGTKLGNCFFVQAASKRINGTVHFRYEDIYMLKNFSLIHFIDAIEAGMLYIDFDARTGHNHGTKFRIKRSALTSLYESSTTY